MRELQLVLRQAVSELKSYEDRAKDVNDALKSVVRRIEYEKDPQTKRISLRILLH